MGLSQEEHWSELPFSSPGDLPDPGIESTSSAAPASAGEFFTPEPPGRFFTPEPPGRCFTPEPPGKPRVTHLSPQAQNRVRPWE